MHLRQSGTAQNSCWYVPVWQECPHAYQHVRMDYAYTRMHMYEMIHTLCDAAATYVSANACKNMHKMLHTRICTATSFLWIIHLPVRGLVLCACAWPSGHVSRLEQRYTHAHLDHQCPWIVQLYGRASAIHECGKVQANYGAYEQILSQPAL